MLILTNSRSMEAPNQLYCSISHYYFLKEISILKKKNKVFILNNSTDFYKILTHMKVQEKSSISLKAFFSNLETIGAMIH